MRIPFLILILIHGLIHILGFLKAFELAEIKELTLSISKTWGWFWLFSCVLMFVFGALYFINYKYWWLIGIIAALISQCLILFFWSGAKIGTIPNVLILLASVVGLFEFRFDNQVKKEMGMVHATNTIKNEVLTQDLIVGLPKPIQNWLTSSGAIGKPIIQTVDLDQKFKLKMKPDQESWYEGRAKQYFNLDKPSFLWTIDLQMMPLVGVKGRDLFMDGKGEMLIKLLSVFPVVNEKDNFKINRGTLQRFLGEIVWFPTAAISSFITWEEIDENSARATLTYQGTSGSGTFTFNDKGEFVRFSTMRYMGSDEEAEPREWIIEVDKMETKNGIKIPTHCKATWKLEDKDWTWAIIEITNIHYDKNTSHH